MSEKSIKLKDITLQDDVERLVILRKRLNKDQHQFANELNITSQYLSAVENYRSPFSKRLRGKIDHYLERTFLGRGGNSL